MTLAELTEKLRSAGVDNPEHDARVLMREFGGKKFDTPLIPRNAESDAPELLAAAEGLLALAKKSKGRTNKDLAKFTAQIRNLIEKWK